MCNVYTCVCYTLFSQPLEGQLHAPCLFPMYKCPFVLNTPLFPKNKDII